MTLTVTASMTTPSRAGKAPRPVWNVSGPDLDLYAEALYALGGRKWRGAFSFFDDPTEAIARLGDQDRQTFAERQETIRERAGERADRLRDRSDKHAAEAERESATAHQMMDVIPLGQPMLVDHYSYGRDRRFRERIGRKLERSADEASYAQNLAGRAAMNERKAEGDHTPAFCGRRIADAQAEVRDLDRKLAGPYAADPRNGDRWRVARDLAAEKVAYWRAELERLGGVRYDRLTLDVGDEVQIRGAWFRVVRLNPTTVAVTTVVGTLTRPYAEVQDRRVVTGS